MWRTGGSDVKESDRVAFWRESQWEQRYLRRSEHWGKVTIRKKTYWLSPVSFSSRSMSVSRSLSEHGPYLIVRVRSRERGRMGVVTNREMKLELKEVGFSLGLALAFRASSPVRLSPSELWIRSRLAVRSVLFNSAVDTTHLIFHQSSQLWCLILKFFIQQVHKQLRESREIISLARNSCS